MVPIIGFSSSSGSPILSSSFLRFCSCVHYEKGRKAVRWMGFVQSWWDRPWDRGKQTMGLYEKRMIARMGREAYFSYYANQRFGLWLCFFSQHIPQVFAFSKFLFFMAFLISSFHFFFLGLTIEISDEERLVVDFLFFFLVELYWRFKLEFQ